MTTEQAANTPAPAPQRVKPRILSGFRDFLPAQMLLRQEIIGRFRSIFERHGYEPIETPILEHLDVLTGKAGENERLMYHFTDHGDRRVGMRYDLTVPLARVLAGAASGRGGNPGSHSGSVASPAEVRGRAYSPDETLACGAIGGLPDPSGNLYVGLAEVDDSGIWGVAWLQGAGSTTTATIFLMRIPGREGAYSGALSSPEGQ